MQDRMNSFIAAALSVTLVAHSVFAAPSCTAQASDRSRGDSCCSAQASDQDSHSSCCPPGNCSCNSRPDEGDPTSTCSCGWNPVDPATPAAPKRRNATLRSCQDITVTAADVRADTQLRNRQSGLVSRLAPKPGEHPRAQILLCVWQT